MKLTNPTSKVIFAKTRIDGKWWDGLLPGDVVNVDSPYSIEALKKHGCVEYVEEKPKPVKKRVRKKKKKGGR